MVFYCAILATKVKKNLSFQQQSTTISLASSLVCPSCTIRLERQALEWGENYRFQSCADVDIVSQAVRAILQNHIPLHVLE